MASVNYITQLTKKRKAVIYFEFISFLCNLGIFLSIPIFVYFRFVRRVFYSSQLLFVPTIELHFRVWELVRLLEKKTAVIFEVCTTMKIHVRPLNVTHGCCLVIGDEHFGGTYPTHLQGLEEHTLLSFKGLSYRQGKHISPQRWCPPTRV
jgi:hypothetical protein